MSRFRPAISRRLPSSSSFAELFLAPGPEAIGVTGDNSYASMFGYDWLLVWDRDDGLLHLWQLQHDGAWVEVLADLPPLFASPAPVGSRRWSLAFDQSARVILAYEDATGIVRVTRWDPSSNSYVQNVSFAGCDPCVVMDASWRYLVPDSDVLLFYLSSDRERVLCRVQRDVYAVEYEIWDYGGGVIPGPPDPRTDDNATTATTGSSYPAWSSAITINEDGLLTHVRHDAFAAGTHTLTINGGTPITAGGGPGVIEFTLPTPMPVEATDVLTVRIAPPSNARVNYDSGSHSGSLWSASSVTFEGFGPFAGSPALGLTIDVSEPVPVPGQPVILDRVIALPYKYQVLVSDATGSPLPDALVSELYPVALATGVRLEPEFLTGEYRQVAYPYAPTLGVELSAEFVAGALTLPVTTYSPTVGVELLPEFLSGELKDVVTKYQPNLGVQLEPEFHAGALDEVGVPYAPNLGVELTTEFIGGVYEPG